MNKNRTDCVFSPCFSNIFLKKKKIDHKMSNVHDVREVYKHRDTH